MGDSIFSHIMAGDVPEFIVYENDYICTLLDINLVNSRHTLIVPKKKKLRCLLKRSNKNLMK